MKGEADTNEKAGRHVAASRVLERAHVLAPGDLDVLHALARTATDAGRFAVAARAGAECRSFSRLGAVATLTVTFGCRGSWPRATWISSSQAPTGKTTALPPNACLSDVVVPPCDWEKRQKKAFDARRKYLRSAFPGDALVRAIVSAPAGPPRPGKKLYAYRRAFDEVVWCREREMHVDAESDLAVSVIPIEWPEPSKSLQVWIHEPAIDSVLFGLVAADSADDAIALVRGTSGDRASVPGAFGPPPNTWTAVNLCNACD
jgi:hypothetical protein